MSNASVDLESKPLVKSPANANAKIGANWLVCLACFMSFCAREYFSKLVAIWWPTFAFVCLGYDHVVRLRASTSKLRELLADCVVI